MTSTPLTSPQHVFLEKVVARSRARRFLNVGSYNLLAWIVLAIYLLPVACMLVTALKSTDQLSDNKAPWYPSKISTYEYLGQADELYQVPTKQGVRKLGLSSRVSARASSSTHRPHSRTDRMEWRLSKTGCGL